jgi:kynurenine formamidase
MSVPAFADLARPDATGLPLAWGVWGAEDQLGTLNNIDAETTAAGAALVRRGLRFNLNLPLHVPLGEVGPLAHRHRAAPAQTLICASLAGLTVRDDRVDGLYPQASTQWDGLCHIGDPIHGFYNGVRPEEITQREGTKLGVEHYVQFGIATRGVMIDLPRHFARIGRAWSPMGSQTASAADLAAALEQTGTAPRRGDVLLVRTGWVEAFRAAQDGAERDALFRDRTYSGLAADSAMWGFLWDSGIAAVASDCVTVEAWPIQEGKPSLHLAIARLGLVLGELFDLDSLAEECARSGVHTCFFVSSPLNLRGGVGSPANAMAIV